MSVDYERRGRVAVITVDRPDVRNAIDRATARALGDAWRTFDGDDKVDVGVLYGAGGHFSAGADLKAFDLVGDPAGYLGFTGLTVGKPTIAAVEGYCVAGGLEMAIWCDLRVASTEAVFGCLERRFGVPLVDGGTVRLPQIIGLGLALELILTGREVTADEALVIGLVNEVVPAGTALDRAVALAASIASHPQPTVRTDRAAVLAGLGLPTSEGFAIARRYGETVMDVAAAGADRFARGAGRSGAAVADFGDGDAESVPTPDLDQPDDLRLTPAASGQGRPVLVVGPDEPSGWREEVTSRLTGMGYTTYDVVTSGELDLDLEELSRAVTAVMGSAAVLGDRAGILAVGTGAIPALHFSTTDPEVSAVVELSGFAPRTVPSFRLATAAYLGHHGSLDERPGVISPHGMETQLRDMGLDATFHTYREAGPDFFVPGSGDHNPRLAEVMWERTRLFLDRWL
ncbi:MAG: crotonase/enoyl-CoA hydratase family protein [Acidimicrobiia bacterium]|nr:crotonase/enoyl-CoA hydratase family protein [Acidimicrobiia bacterium]